MTMDTKALGTEVNGGFELDWNSEIKDEGTFKVAPEGDYDFTVTQFDREKYEGSKNANGLPPCWRAVLTLSIVGADGQRYSMKHNLYLHSRTEGLISAFFLATGQKKHGEPLRPDWDAVVGSTGRCHVVIKKGRDKDFNNIKKFYDKDTKGSEQPKPQAAYQPGVF